MITSFLIKLKEKMAVQAKELMVCPYHFRAAGIEEMYSWNDKEGVNVIYGCIGSYDESGGKLELRERCNSCLLNDMFIEAHVEKMVESRGAREEKALEEKVEVFVFEAVPILAAVGP